MRFLTVTCNPAIDVTYRLNALEPGAINRIGQVFPVAGGKGNNVARVLAALDCTPIATGFLGGDTGRFIENELRLAGVEPTFVGVSGESRRCLTLIETQSGRITEIREPGVAVQAADGDRLLAHVTTLTARVDVAIIAGSLPPGLDGNFIARLIAVLKRSNVKVALDAGGEVLRRGVAARPDLIKPNLDELLELVGGSPEEVIERTRRYLIGPVLDPEATVLLSMGASGAALIRQNEGWRASPPPIEVINSVGSGDALLAAYLDASARQERLSAALVQAVAVGTAAALQEPVASFDMLDVHRLATQIRVWPLTRPTESPGDTARAPMKSSPEMVNGTGWSRR